MASLDREPWEHPDWYDLHDTAWSAGSEREPEHYRELVLALPPLGAKDHLIDMGAGTGKLTCLIARGYRDLGRVTLVEPNAPKLARAEASVRALLPSASIHTLEGGLGGEDFFSVRGDVMVVGSVFMPIMTLRGGTFGEGLDWLLRALRGAAAMVERGGLFFAAETLAAPWDRGGEHHPVRRLTLMELTDLVERAGFEAVECVYRFRDRVVLRARRR